MDMSFRSLERIVRGFANHRRIQVMELLSQRPELDLAALARATGMNYKTASEHLRRLAVAGLVLKKAKGTHVLHAISPRGKSALKFLRTVE
jgi:DNA-binding transcriptional ArsR family regulator